MFDIHKTTHNYTNAHFYGHIQHLSTGKYVQHTRAENAG